MLSRLLSALLYRKPKAPQVAERPVSYRTTLHGTAVMADGSAHAAISVSSEAAAGITVESSARLRSSALLQTHYLPDVSPDAVFALHRRYGRMFEDEAASSPRPALHVEADPHRRLRIGYVSPNFASHSVSYFIEPVLAHHDRRDYEVYGYHTGAICDDTTDVLEASVDRWRQVDTLSDDALARRIAEDRIDIAIDLAGHTSSRHMAVFARRSAPVQVTWIGYPDTTGLEAIDYRITDAIADPAPHADERHTETLIRLPGAFLCYRPPADAPAVSVRDDADPIVFCSFNTLEKINDAVIALWSRVLGAVPGSRLLLKDRRLVAEPVAQRLRGAFAARGIDAARIDFRDWIEARSEHLALYGRCDIALDTWPYNGTTTTCEALWMGVPVVTLAGEAHMSRVGATLLTAAGLNELIAHTADEFVDTATALARAGARRHALRGTLRPMLAASPLLDHAAFTRKLEAALREVWVAWCASPRRRAGG